ncbi:MAG: DEAD/DEAH box helicase [Chloroflexota bacterium]
MSFDHLGLMPELLRAVADQGYTEPTAVQNEAIPLVLTGRDLLAGAQTGTGKTAAFVLPILQRLHATRPTAARPLVAPGRAAAGRSIRVLVLVPTRELALQVEESVRTYGARRPVRSTPIYGGVGFDPQVRALRAGPAIVVATPGRLLDHAGQGTIDLGGVEVLVLDEADRMLDMGFIRDIRRILALLPARRQNLLFSATFSDEIRRLADGLLDRPAVVQVTPRNTTAELVRQVVHPVDRERKRELLSHLVRSGRIDQALVFTRTKHGANRLAEQLARDGIVAAAIHGNKSQGQRVRALADFKAGRTAILVATEVAARGLDIEALPHVVNYELSMVPEDYVHRIGRTGRAGMDGDAVSLVCVDEAKLLRDIETLLGRRIPVEVVPGFEPDRSIRPEPIRLRTGDGRAIGGGRPGARPGGRAGAGRPSAGRSAPVHGGFVPARRPGIGNPRPASARPGIGNPRPAAPGQLTPVRPPLPRLGDRGQAPAVLPGERLARRADR